MADLHLPMKGIYFDQIARGEKPFEYRLVNEYWCKRLLVRTYDRIVLTRGYPKGGGIDGKTRLVRPWRGCGIEMITHDHFGPKSVCVFAIPV